MQPSLIGLMVLFAFLAGLGFFLGFYRPAGPFRHYAQTLFVMCLFFLMPIDGCVLYQQSQAKERLASRGIAPHPALKEAIGMATGSGRNPIWLFRAESSAENVLQHYRHSEALPDWALMSDGPVMLVFSNQTGRLVISASDEGEDSTVSYSLNGEWQFTLR